MDFLEYSAQEPMLKLRKKFNNGEQINKDIPTSITVQEATEDVCYVEYVMKNAYSGYSYYDEAQFDKAFESLKNKVSHITEGVKPEKLVDMLAEALSFISDGHLAFTANEYGKGFYKKLQTFVADCVLYEENGCFFDLSSKKRVSFSEDIRAFPTTPKNGKKLFLLGVRSKEPVNGIQVIIEDHPVVLPVRKIRGERRNDAFLKESYEDGIAVICCSDFVGDKEEDLKKLYEVGKKCSRYQHVIWDLSNNLGGNSEFPKQFLNGLDGGYTDTSDTLELKSTLVYAKETGIIAPVPYSLEPALADSVDKAGFFCGRLHVIINDQVASSAELAVAMAKHIPNTTFYGCNTLGIGRFGDLCIYYLPNTHIVLWCPQKVFDTGIIEEVGFEPDYWTDTEDPISAVKEFIDEQETLNN